MNHPEDTRNLLLVEDNPGDIRLFQEGLKECQVDINLYVARAGEEALAFLRSNSPLPCLILLDLNLPGLSGREVLAHLKSNPEFKSIPVIVLTSSEAEEDVQTAYENHANCYIVKPVSLDDFLPIINAIEKFWLESVRLPALEKNDR